MKKRNYISYTLLSILLLVQTVFAENIFDRVTSIWSPVFRSIGQDLQTQAGQIFAIKLILFFLLAVVLYEVAVRLLGQRPLIGGIVGALVSLGIMLIIPSGSLLAVFSAGSAVVLMLIMVLVLGVPSVLTYMGLQLQKPSLNAAMGVIWFIGITIFHNAVTGINTGEDILLIDLSVTYGWIVSIGLIVWAVTHWGTRTVTGPTRLGWSGVKKLVGKFDGMALRAQTKRAAALEVDLKAHIATLRAADNWTAVAVGGAPAAGNAYSWSQGICKKHMDVIKADLQKIEAILIAETHKDEVKALPALVDEITLLNEAITTAGNEHRAGYPYRAPPRGGLSTWLGFVEVSWSGPVLSIDNVNNLDTLAGQKAELKELHKALVEFDRYLRHINNQLVKL